MASFGMSGVIYFAILNLMVDINLFNLLIGVFERILTWFNDADWIFATEIYS